MMKVDRPDPISLDAVVTNSGMAMNQGGWDEAKVDQGQAGW
jgi:hypothetical protein